METTILKLNNEEIFYMIIHICTIMFLMKSVFHIYKSRKKIKWYVSFTWLTILGCGIYYLAKQINNIEIIYDLFPFMTIYIIGSAYAIYKMSLIIKEDVFSIQNMITDYLSRKHEFSKILNFSKIINKKSVLKTKILAKGKEVTIVTYDDLRLLENYTIEILAGKLTGVVKLPMDDENKLMFKGFMKMKGEFGIQKHPKATETIFIDEGKVLELYTNKVYVKGDRIDLKEEQPHGFKSLVGFSVLRGILTKTID